MHEFNGRLPTRDGTNEDAEKLTKVFSDLGFEILRMDNGSKEEVLNKLEESECN